MEPNSLIFDFGIAPHILRPKEDNEVFISNTINPKISVVTISYNHGQYIEDNILSIARQSYKNFEHIIIDNLSTDNTSTIASKYPHLTFVSEKDRGTIDALFKGAYLSKGDYIMISTATDGLLSENWFKTCMDIFNKDPEISLIWGPGQTLQDGLLQNNVNYPIFWDQNRPDYIDCPQKEEWFTFWKQHKYWFNELNMIVKREVFMECFTQACWEAIHAYYKNGSKYTISEIFEFNLYFNKKRYYPYFVKEIAHFGRVHQNQLTWQVDSQYMLDDYNKKVDMIK